MEIPLIKNILNEKNKNVLIGLITVLIILWSLIYAIPSILGSFFTTILGNVILILIIILLSINNVLYGLSAALLFFILYRIIKMSSVIETKVKEGFTWNQETINDFTKLQKLINPDLVFHLNKIQEQASQQEVNYYMKNKLWPWSKEVIEMYKNAILKNSYVRTYTGDSVTEARNVYNQNAILYILSLQEKEGLFLTKGVQVYTNEDNNRNGNGSYGYAESGLINIDNNPIASVIKCDNSDKSSIEDKSSIAKYHNGKKIAIDYNNLESIIPGFNFVKGKCDPCENNPGNYSCPFELNIEGVNKGISSVWKYLWKTN
jgi:hypothetical protein